MRDAATFLGVKAKYTGAVLYDIGAEVDVLETVISQGPDGILLTVIDPDGLQATIDNAVSQDLPLVTFDADSPRSKRYGFVGTNNYKAGVVAARYLGTLLREGKVAISSVPTQLNHIQRRAGFNDTLKAEFPNIVTSDALTVDDESTLTVAATKMTSLLTTNADIRGIFATESQGGAGVAQAVAETGKTDIKIVAFDYDPATLDLIDQNKISATLAQSTWQMGFWGMLQLYMVRNERIKSVSDWRGAGISPLPVNVDTGVVVVTKDNSQLWRTTNPPSTQ